MYQMTNAIQEKHLLEVTEWRGAGYMDSSLVDIDKSYYIQSRPTTYGGRYVYQYIVMKDGTVYELSSHTASTRGIMAYNCHGSNELQRDIKARTRKDGVIHY